MNTNYGLEMERIIAGFAEKPLLLLHSCCAPCSTAVLERLAAHFRLSVLFYNPSIRPREEYEIRLFWLKKLVAENYPEIEIIEDGWHAEDFDAIARGLEAQPEGGARCELCLRQRLEKTARAAKTLGITYYCTTLTVSPHKNAEVINRFGFELEREHGVRWLPSDFKKNDGYRRSIELSKQLGLYRQSYCACTPPKNLV